MDIKDIIKALPDEQKDEASKFLEGLKLNADIGIQVSGIDSMEKAKIYIDDNEWFKKAKHSIESIANEAYKVNHYEKDLEKIKKDSKDEIRKEMNPEETPIEKELRELREAMTQKERNDERRDRRDFASKQLHEFKFSDELAGVLASEDDESTSKNIKTLTDFYITPLQEKITELEKKLKIEDAKTGKTPGNGKDFTGIKNPFLHDIHGNPTVVNGKMVGRPDLGMQGKLSKENPDLYKKFEAEKNQVR